jgi:phage tail-like protein
LAIQFLNALNPLDRRNRVSDYLLNTHFHVFDVSFSSPQVFTLIYGFNFVTAPELNIEMKEIKEGTFEYKKSVFHSANIADIDMHRGVKFYDSDFYDWIVAYLKGQQNQRKNLLLVQYSQIAVGALAGNGNDGSFLGFTPLTDLVSRVPARAWYLIDCAPTRYKSASDHDSLGGQISIAELTVRPLFFEEFNTGI